MKILHIIAATIVVSACSIAKPVAKTVNDAARIACEVAFGQEKLPQGLKVEQLCEAQEDLQPFIRNILAAKQAVGAAHGMPPPTEE